MDLDNTSKVLLFVLYLGFGGVILSLILVCCARCINVIKEQDKLMMLCFKNKMRERRRIVMSTLNHDFLPSPVRHSSNLTPPPDEDINSERICSPYIYGDGCTTGLSMIPNLPISIAIHGLSSATIDAINPTHLPQHFSPLDCNIPTNVFNASVFQPVVKRIESPPPKYFDTINQLPPSDPLDLEDEEEDDHRSLDDSDLFIDDKSPPPTYQECTIDFTFTETATTDDVNIHM